MPDFLKLIEQRRKEKGLSSSSETAVTEPEKKQTTSPTSKQNNFEKNFSELSSYKYEDGSSLYDNLSTNKLLVNTINGLNDDVFKSLDPKSEIGQNAKLAKDAMWYGMNLYKKGEIEKANEYLERGENYFEKFATSYSALKNSDYVYSDKEERFVTRKDFEKSSNEVTYFYDKDNQPYMTADKLKESYNSDNVIRAGYAYFTSRGIEEGAKNHAKSKMQSVVKQWGSNSFANITNLGAKQKEETYGLVADVISYVSKYGTLNKGDKSEAIKIYKDLKGKDWKSKVEYVKNNSNKLNSLISNMGFYGTEYLYNKYAKDPSIRNKYYFHNSEYTQDKDGSLIDKLYNDADNAFMSYQDTMKTQINARQKRVEHLKNISWSDKPESNNIHSELFATILDDNGHILKYNDWRKTLSKKGLQKSLDELVVLEKGYNKVGNTWNTVVQSGTDNYVSNRTDDVGSYIAGLYNRYKSEYKRAEVEINEPDFKWDPNKSNPLIGYPRVDLSGKRQAGNTKYEHSKNVLNLVWNNNSNELDTDVFLNIQKGDNYTYNTGRFGSQDVEMFTNNKELRKLQNEKFKAFIDAKPEDVNVVLESKTSIPNYSAYHFFDNNSKLNMTVFIPTVKLSTELNDPLLKATRWNNDDFKFETTGEVPLTIPGLSNTKIKRKKDGVYFQYEKNGNFDEVLIPSQSRDVKALIEIVRNNAKNL